MGVVMIESYKCEYFRIEELVPPTVFAARGAKAWQQLDIRLLQNMDALREALGVSVTCNNWHTGGPREDSGLRLSSLTYNSPFSQHVYGRAGDTICSVSADEIRADLRSGVIVLPHPASFEEFPDMSWLHMDVRNMTNEHAHFFLP